VDTNGDGVGDACEGMAADAGVEADAGAQADAGVEADAGMQTDAGVQAGADAGAGAQPDANDTATSGGCASIPAPSVLALLLVLLAWRRARPG